MGDDTFETGLWYGCPVLGNGWLWMHGPTLSYDIGPWCCRRHKASKAFPIKIKNPRITVVRFGYSEQGRVALKLKDTGFSFFRGNEAAF